MKVLLFVILLLGACTQPDKAEEHSPVSEEEISAEVREILAVDLAAKEKELAQIFKEEIPAEETLAIVKGLINKDYRVLDKYLSREALYPYIYVIDGYIIRYPVDTGESFEPSTNEIYTNFVSFKNTGKIIAYTNQYGVVFFNDEEILLSLDEVNTVDHGGDFIYLYESVYQGVYPEYLERITNYIDKFYRYEYSDIIEIALFWNPDYFDRDTIEQLMSAYDYEEGNIYPKKWYPGDYIFNKMFPQDDPEKFRIIFLNYLAHPIFSDGGDSVRLPKPHL